MVIGPPGTVALGIHGDVRLRERSIKPIGEAMVIGNQHHLKTPFFPVGLGVIETQICRPGRFRYELNGRERFTGPKRGNGGKLRSLGGRCSRRVRPRAQRGIIAHRNGRRDAGGPLVGGAS